MADATTPRTALVVDDDPLMRRLVVRGIETLGFDRILEAGDGEPAQRLLREHDVDLVITDLVMPGLDGLGLMRWAQGERPGPHWIILSGVETFDAAVDAIHLGAFEFLSKPPEVKMLQVAVRNALSHRDLVREKERLLEELQASSVELLETVRELEHKSQVIRADLERAEQIQRALLPQRLPDLSGLSVHALYRPGRNVGGDLYDVARIGDEATFYVADATGHGVAAAMLSVLFKQRLQMSNGAGTALAPAAVMASVNEHLHTDNAAPGMFLTAAYCVLDPKDGRLRIASAGHPPILVARNDGTREWIARTGPALGLEGASSYGERLLALREGDRIFLYTDGLVGGQPDSAATCRELEHVVAAKEQDAGALLHELFDGAVRRQGAVALAGERDDITMLLVEAVAGRSVLDNGSPSRERVAVPDTGKDAVVWAGDSETTMVLSVRGRGSWTHSDAFFRVARRAVDAGRSLAVDLTACEHLDSAFLGTIHEVVRLGRDGDVTLHGPSRAVRNLFDELCMAKVAECFRDDAPDHAARLEPVRPTDPAARHSQLRLLRAHEILASLSERNRRKFQPIADALRNELGETE